MDAKERRLRSEANGPAFKRTSIIGGLMRNLKATATGREKAKTTLKLHG
jgi:hypothetical protein